jgi:hypothetical protein
VSELHGPVPGRLLLLLPLLRGGRGRASPRPQAQRMLLRRRYTLNPSSRRHSLWAAMSAAQ